MKLFWIIIPMVMFPAGRIHAEDRPVLNTLKDKISYAIGVNIIRNLNQQGIDLDLDVMIKGMKDSFSNQELLMPDKDINILISTMQNDLNQKQIDNRAMATKAYAFLEENKKREGIITLSDGLQYKVLKAGNAKKPVNSDTVEINYKGTHIDDTEFVNSYRTGNPVIVKVDGGAIPGLCEALKLMPAGSRWRIFIPPHLAYGERGLSPNIGPFETLIYEVELISIR